MGRQDKWDRARLEELYEGMNRHEFVLRFTLTCPDCHTTIVGTIDPDHLAANISVAAGSLPNQVGPQTIPSSTL